MSETPRLPDPPQPAPAPPDGPGPVRARPRSRGWIWYFVAPVVLSLAAVTTIVVYRWGQILTPERLEAARKLWKEKGPKDYEFRYVKRIGPEDRPEHYTVVVRGGEVQSVTVTTVKGL